MNKNIEIEIINRYRSEENMEELVEEFDLDLVEFHNIFQKHGVKIKREDWGKVSSKKQRFHIDRDELYNLYIIQNKTRKEVADYFGCSVALIQKRCGEYGIKKEPKKAVKNTQKTLKKKYGTSQLHKINKKKRIQTNKKRYGGATPFHSPKIQQKIAKGRIISDDEAIVIQALKELGYDFKREYLVEIENQNQKFLIFDLLVTKDNKPIFFIEVNGYFHHVENAYDKKSFDRVIRAKESDLRKLKYCRDKKIPCMMINEPSVSLTIEQIKNKILDFNRKIKL